MTSNNCIFCTDLIPKIITENELAFVIYDGFPVTEFHSLIIPKRHVVDYFQLSEQEVRSCNELLHLMQKKIQIDDKEVLGFNIGVNCGEVAGQTVLHCHIHLIPRRVGDVDNPRGGIRHLIPGKGYY